MQVSNINDINVYNLSYGKTIPEWLSDRKKRMLLKRDVDLRRRIQLIQDFEMPTVCNTIKTSRDNDYVIACGVYKPRVRCYDVNQLAMKFERCFDSECVQFDILSDDYSKIILLQADRHVEIHSQFGRYYRTRIPKFGRDMCYNYSTCDVYFVGNSSQVYRLNLEEGKFLNPFQTDCVSHNVCAINREHNLFVCGSQEARVEAWDPRNRSRVGVLDCALATICSDTAVDGFPSVTAIAFRDGLNMAVGTATGQILLYDIRSSKPYYVKDHMYGLPIKDIEFINGLDLVASLDCKILKLWHRNTGEPYTAIQADRDLNDLCVVPNTGMLFIASEAPKILSYYIPSIGPAPKWCSFLDRITEELEESTENTIYDDYKFVTEKELNDLNLTHLKGSDLLRAHMHGFFIDIRLYYKTKAMSDTFAYDEYRKKKIKEKIEAERTDRVQIKSDFPAVNKELAQRIVEQQSLQTKKAKKKQKYNLLDDNRFKDIFANPDFQIDEQSEEYRLLHPVLNKMDKPKKPSDQYINSAFDEIDDNDDDYKKPIESSDSDGVSDESESSDDNHTWTKEVKETHRKLRIERNARKYEDNADVSDVKSKFYKLKDGKTYDSIISNVDSSADQTSRVTFEDRLKHSDKDYSDLMNARGGANGNRIMTFELKDSKNAKKRDNRDEMRKHLVERKKLARSAKGIKFSAKKS